MKTTGLHSPFIDGELLGAPPPAASPFEQVMVEPKAQPMPATAAAGVRVVDAKGDPLSGVGWSLHQGTLVLRGTLANGEADVLAQGAKSFDRSKPFRFHVDGHVCSIVSGAALLVDEAGVEYGGSLFDWRAADSADATVRSAFWKDYAARRQQDEAPHVFQFIQHDHVMRRPVRWLKSTNLVIFQAQPLAIRLGPVVRYTDDRQARIWLELNAPGLVRVQYGPAPDAKKKPTSRSEPTGLRTRHTCSVRVGGRHYAMLTLDELPADAAVMYTLELAPQPPTGPLPGTEGDFTEARFPRQLPTAALAAQHSALAQMSLAGRHWLFLRTLPSSSEGLRFAHGSCRVHPGDTDEHQQVQGADMLARFGSDFLARKELSTWPQFFMHTGDQIYADDIGVRLGRQLLRQRFSATEPGPRQGDALLRGAWGGRFGLRVVSRQLLQPSKTAAADVDEIDRGRNTAQNPARVQKLVEHARSALAQAGVFPGVTAPAAQKLQVLNQLLWQPPISADDVPQVDTRRGLLQAPTFRVQKPQPHDVRLPHPAAGDIGGVHLADYAEYAAAYEQAWTVHGARRSLAHLPNYMIFDDHEVTDDWNADAGWLACVHSKRDPLRMWPHTMTDALAAYWLYQGWGNLAPAVAAADPRVQILERARHQGHDALPELRRLIHDRAVAPSAKQATPAQRSTQLAWNFRVPTPGTPFLVVDLRTDRDVHGSGGMSKTRLDWLETALRAARTHSAFVVLPVPLLMPAPLVFAMRHPWVGALATGADSTEEFRRKADIEHPVSNLVWAQFRDLLQRLQRAGSPLRTLAIVSGDIHFSCNLDGQLPDSKQGPRLLQLISSGLCKVVSTEKQANLASAYRGWLHVLTGSRGVDTQRGVRMTLGGLEGPLPLAADGLPVRTGPRQPELKNFVFPTSVALVDVVPTRTQPAGRVLGDTALIKQMHFVDAGCGRLDGWSFNHATRAEGGWMTLNDPGLGYTDRPDSYPRDSRPMGLVRELLDEMETTDEAAQPGEFELVHETLHGEAEPALELIEPEGEPEAQPELEEEDAGGPVYEAYAPPEPSQPEVPMEGCTSPEMDHEVLGTEQRQLVPDPLGVPHRWICALDVFFDTSVLPPGTQIHDHTRATGVLIGPRHVLTARHVIEPSPVRVNGTPYRPRVTRIRVTPARNGDNRDAPIAHAWVTKRFPAIPFTPQPGARPVHPDYALLILDTDLAAKSHARIGRLGYWGEDTGLAELRAMDLDRAPAGDVTVAGYPGDTSGDTILLRKERAAGTATEADIANAVAEAQRSEPRRWASRPWHDRGPATVMKHNATLYHVADTFGGQSGAPVMQLQSCVWQLLAVHHGTGARDATSNQLLNNSASAVSPRMLDELVRWINADAGGTVASVQQGRLALDAFVAAKLAAPRQRETDEAFEEAEEAPLDDESPRADRVAGTAMLVHQGLKQAETWLRRQPRRGVPELLRFAVSLLRTHFFPKGHGVIDGAGHVAHQAPAARIAMRLRARDGSPLPFEHRVRLWIDARAAQPAVVAGRHADALFSSITLHAPAFAGLAPAVAVQHAVHEVLHMLITLVERLRQRHGDAMADAFLQKDPWSLLDLRRFDSWRGRLEQALQPLLHLLRAPEPAAAAAGRLVEEAFCHTGGMQLRFTLERGGRSGIVASSVTETLVRHYVLDHAPRLSALLGSDELAKAVAPLRPVLDELQERMNADWQGGAATVAPQPEALFEPF